MRPCFPRLALTMVFGVVLAGSVRAGDDVPANARVSTIKDEAGLFSDEAKARADTEIQDIRKTFGINLFVDTVSTIPPEERSRLRFWDRRQVVQFLAKKALEHAKEAKVDGIFVVIYGKRKGWWKGGNDVQVLVWPESEANRFPLRDCEALRGMLVRELYESHYDAALLDLVSRVKERLQARANGQEIDADAIRLAVVMVLIASLVGVSLLLFLVRTYLRRKQASMAEVGVQRAERPALLASLFGTPAAFWVTDRLMDTIPPEPGAPLREPEPPVIVSSEEGEPPVQQPTDESTENAPV